MSANFDEGARLGTQIFFEELLDHLSGADIVGTVKRLESNLTNTTNQFPVRLYAK